MNGRAYDYNLGRFLSVDPFIQAPGNSQSMNPYSYIMNNPLAGTDPSGYIAEISDRDGRCMTVKCDIEKLTADFTSHNGTGSQGRIKAKREEDATSIMSNPDYDFEAVAPAGTGGKVVITQSASTKSEKELYKTTLNEFSTFINANIETKIENNEFIISGTYSGNTKFSADEFMKYVKDELEGKDYVVDELNYSIVLDFRFINSRKHSAIDITSIRSLPNEDLSSSYRSNADKGEKFVRFASLGRYRQKVATHEFLHLLGFGDTYTDSNGSSVTWEGHESDIMGTKEGSFQNYHMKVLLQRYGNK